MGVKSKKKKNRRQEIKIVASRDEIKQKATEDPLEEASAEASYYTEEELSELLHQNLHQIYIDAVSKLITFGYDENLSRSAVIKSGSCYGSMDALSNVIQNSLIRLNSSAVAPFSILQQAAEYSFTDLVSFLLQLRPNLNWAEAIWCLLSGSLQISRAYIVAVPLNGETEDSCDVETDIAQYFGLSRDSGLILRRHVEVFTGVFGSKPRVPQISAAKFSELCAFSAKQILEDCTSGVTFSDDLTGPDSVVSTVTDELGNHRTEEDDSVDRISGQSREEIIKDYTGRICDHHLKLIETMKGAQVQALEAAKDLSKGLTELRTLRQKREEKLNGVIRREMMDDLVIRMIEDAEEDLRKEIEDVDTMINEAHEVDKENQELKAMVEEFVTKSAAVAKNEEQMKGLIAWEKQREELQSRIQAERSKIDESQRRLIEIQMEKTEKEEKMKAETKAKQEAMESAEEVPRAKQEAMESAKEVLRAKQEAMERAKEVPSAKEAAMERAKEGPRAKEAAMKRAKEVPGAKEEAMDRAKEVPRAKEEAMERAKGVPIAKEEAVERAKEVPRAKEEAMERSKEVPRAKEATERAKEVPRAKQEAMERAKEAPGAKEEAMESAKEVLRAKQEAMERAKEVPSAKEAAMERAKEGPRAKEAAMERAKEVPGAKEEAMERAKEVPRAEEEAMERAKEVPRAKEEATERAKEVPRDKEVTERAKVPRDKEETTERAKEVPRAKDEAIERAKKVPRAKKEFHISIQQDSEEVYCKINVKFNYQNGNIDHLPNELMDLRATGRSGQSSPLPQSPVTSPSRDLHAPSRPGAWGGNQRECLMCSGEVSVVFQPCAHQVLCDACKGSHELRAKTMFPCKQLPDKE